MNPSVSIPGSRRRILRWFLIGIGLCLTPFAILVIAAASYFVLDRDTVALREQVMRATDARWHTQVQMSLGNATINAVNFGLHFVRTKNGADVCNVLAAVKRVSVGIYECKPSSSRGWPEQFLADTDRVMQKRGWSRLISVVGENNSVLIYVPQDRNGEETMEVCLAGVSRHELVVATARLDASALAELVNHYGSGEPKKHRQLAAGTF